MLHGSVLPGEHAVARYSGQMSESPTVDQTSAPDWEASLREVRSGQTRKVVSLTSARFPALAASLRVARAGSGDAEALGERLLRSVDALDRDLADDWRFDEFRKLVRAGLAWWALPDPEVSRSGWASYVEIVGLRVDRAERVDTSQRSFRHIWCGYRYRVPTGEMGATGFRSSDYEHGKRALGKQAHDALIAFIHALIEGGDGVEYWDPRSNTIRRPTPPETRPVEVMRAEETRTADSEDGVGPQVTPRPTRLGDAVNDFVERAQFVVAEGRLKPATTFNQLGDRLKLMLSIRDTLDKFMPSVFERPLDDMIAAYDSPDVASPLIKAADRRRLKRRAKEHVRPGVAIQNMPKALTAVETQRRKWRAVAAGPGSAPFIPLGLSEIFDRWRALRLELHELSKTPGRDGQKSLEALPFNELAGAIALHGIE